MLGDRESAKCNAGLATGLVLASPVLIPMAIADDARASSVPARPIQKFEPRTEREKELYRAAGGKSTSQ